MNNEQLAGFIKQGGNDEFIPILWERVRNLMYKKADEVYRAYEQRFRQCGVDVWDLKQSSYAAFLKAIEGYKPERETKFTTYLSYPFKNMTAELLGARTQKQKNEPLNTCTSLDVPLNDEEPEGNTLADIIEDENAVDAVAMVEQETEYRILHEVVNGLKYPQNYVINKYYFDNWTFTHIGDILHVSTERVSQIRQKALANLRKSLALRQIYRVQRISESLRNMQFLQSRPDKHIYISELERTLAGLPPPLKNQFFSEGRTPQGDKTIPENLF